MIIDENFHVYHITNYSESHSQTDSQPIVEMNAIRFNLTERAKYEKQKMFIVDDDEDPLNDRMLFFQKTQFNNF